MMTQLLPVWVVGAGALILMLSVAFKRGRHNAIIAAITLLLALISVYFTPMQASTLFVVDGFAKFMATGVLVCALFSALLSMRYFRHDGVVIDEYYLLLLFAVMGAVLMVSAQHLASFFVALELLSIPMYGMISYIYRDKFAMEAGIKYLLLSAAASATLLFGMGLMLLQVGALDFTSIARAVMGQDYLILMVLGAALMIFASGFKLSLAPFHSWTPDVYQGAPMPISAFMSSVSKLAMMALFARMLIAMALPAFDAIMLLLTVMAVLSILVGNLLALAQTNLKRLFAYSSVAHMGYCLVMILGVGARADGVLAMYMLVYAASAVGAFGILSLMSDTKEPTELADLRGLFWQRPLLTAAMTVMVLSMAGIPLTAGFITKIMAIFSGVQGRAWVLVGMIILGSAIGIVYYLRVLLMMFKRPTRVAKVATFGLAEGLVVALAGLLLVLGILPNSLILLSGTAVMGG